MANGLLGCTKFRCISRTTKTTNLVQDVLRQFHVLQFCHVHGHDLATGSDGEGAGADCPFVCFSVVTRVSVCLSLSLPGRALSQLTLTMRQVHAVEKAAMRRRCAVKLSLPA